MQLGFDDFTSYLLEQRSGLFRVDLNRVELTGGSEFQFHYGLEPFHAAFNRPFRELDELFCVRNFRRHFLSSSFVGKDDSENINLNRFSR